RFSAKWRTSNTRSSKPTYSGVSNKVSRDFTQSMDSWIRWSGVSCGKIPKPPRRAIVSTMRRPVTPFMFDETIGIEVPVPSVEEISTSIRELICEKDGTRKTSEYVRSVVTGLRKRILPSCQLFLRLTAFHKPSTLDA